MIKFLIRSALFAFVTYCLSGCVPASDDEFDEIYVGKLPLKTGNKWVYEITRGSGSFTDSAEIKDYLPYQIDEITNRYLYLYKDIAFTLMMSEPEYDTVYVKLLEYDNDLLLQYGCEKRDRSGFPYGDAVIFDEPQTVLDHKDNSSVEELFISSLDLNKNGFTITLNDTIVNCIKKRMIQSSGSFITTDLNYDLYYYFTDLGVLKIEGVVNSSAFSAKAVSCILK
ncbi:MAG TPA: hypothetical protein PLK90_06195 [Clostridiales bacterium]|nr:hypothetical protein [Clostridiales bacterium]HQP69973.1 hypothetical protein [Clostridiales bacterium]